MFANIEWDTATILTAILAPLCLVFVTIIFTQWARINELKNDQNAAVTKAADISQRLAESSAQKDAEINRQKKDIEELHKQVSDLKSQIPVEAIGPVVYSDYKPKS
jgi:type VI protein secretion system component VasK